MRQRLVLGLCLDDGYLHARLATADGRPRGRATRVPVDAGSSPRMLADAVRPALADTDTDLAEVARVAYAYPEGESDSLPGPEAVRAACGYLAGVGEPVEVDGAVAAFAAGSAAPDGTVLIGGAGSSAAEIRDRAVTRHAGGHGWLLGDAGSGFWLGRETVRMALAALDTGHPLTDLCRTAIARLLPDYRDDWSARQTVRALVRLVHLTPRAALTQLAPLVMSLYSVGEPEAVRLVQEAADHLFETVAVLRLPHDRHPVVLAGGLLGCDTPLAAAVRTRIGVSWPDAPLYQASETAAAVAWLAGLQVLPTNRIEAEQRHARLLGRVGGVGGFGLFRSPSPEPHGRP